MKIKILSLLTVLMCTLNSNVAVAQFYSDRVLVYVKAGQDPSEATSVCVIAYYSDSDEIRNMSSSAEKIRETISSNPHYFTSPYNIPDKICSLYSGYIAPQYCQYNAYASTSKYRVYSGYDRPGVNWGGQYIEGGTKNWAFSKDAKHMIFWVTGKEDNRVMYVLTDLSEFDPSTSSSSRYDFLE